MLLCPPTIDVIPNVFPINRNFAAFSIKVHVQYAMGLQIPGNLRDIVSDERRVLKESVQIEACLAAIE
jgi:hypothetical protein